MKNNNMVIDVQFTSKASEINCETCAKCKIHATV